MTWLREMGGLLREWWKIEREWAASKKALRRRVKALGEEIASRPKVIDLREGFSYSGDFPEGSTHRLYDIFNAGILGSIGDTLIWKTPHGDVQGEVTETGWENRPLPTRWADVVISRG